jgi:hypothetical protein
MKRSGVFFVEGLAVGESHARSGKARHQGIQAYPSLVKKVRSVWTSPMD